MTYITLQNLSIGYSENNINLIVVKIIFEVLLDLNKQLFQIWVNYVSHFLIHDKIQG